MNISFENLPEAVSRLDERLQNIEKLLQAQNFESNSDMLLTLEEAASHLRLRPATIYDYVHRREIPFSKIKKRLYFSKQELTTWAVTAGKRKTEAETNASANEAIIKPRRKK